VKKTEFGWRFHGYRVERQGKHLYAFYHIYFPEYKRFVRSLRQAYVFMKREFGDCLPPSLENVRVHLLRNPWAA
jgi:hypothetical protein